MIRVLFGPRFHASDLNPPSPRKARTPGDYFTPHRDAFRRPIARGTATPIDVKKIFDVGRKGKKKDAEFWGCSGGVVSE
jgi:hypothetical protein